MKKILAFVFVLFCLIGTIKAQFTDLHDFNGTNGGNPFDAVIYSGNVLYGMTSSGGAHDSGCVFSMNANGSNYKDLFDFAGTNGSKPLGALIISGNKLYGMTSKGGLYHYGVIFSIVTNGTGYSDMHDFNNSQGANPYGTLLLLGRKLFGTTTYGGIGHGTVFSIDTTGTGFKDLFNFNGFVYPQGDQPCGALVYSAGLLYGMTIDGGYHGYGNIYHIDTNGSGYKDLLDFNGTNGIVPAGSLVLSGYKLYGVTSEGGTNYGNIFSIDTNGGGLKNLYNFTIPSYSYPEGLFLSGGYLYGMTAIGGVNSKGSVFQLDTNGSAYKDLLDFNNTNGEAPYGTLIVNNNIIYGMAYQGGANYDGLVFSFQLCSFSVTTAVNANVYCYGGNNGIATASSSGGVSPYTYNWAMLGKTTSVITGLSAGTYTVNVIDNSGCMGSAVATITQPALLRDSISSVTNLSCLSTTGSTTIGVKGGTSPYSYLWNPGGKTTATITGLTAATYTVSITDKNGCSGTASVTITQSATLRDSISVFTCTLRKVYATIGVKGGTTPYTYLWSPLGTTNASVSGVSNGTYTITVTDKNGCSSTMAHTFLCSHSRSGDVDDTAISGGIINNVIVYPNPNSGQFTISFSKPEFVSAPQTIEVYNILGEKVYSQLSIHNLQYTIDLRSKPGGIYFYRVLNNEGCVLDEGKLVIQK